MQILAAGKRLVNPGAAEVPPQFKGTTNVARFDPGFPQEGGTVFTDVTGVRQARDLTAAAWLAPTSADIL